MEAPCRRGFRGRKWVLCKEEQMNFSVRVMSPELQDVGNVEQSKPESTKRSLRLVSGKVRDQVRGDGSSRAAG